MSAELVVISIEEDGKIYGEPNIYCGDISRPRKAFDPLKHNILDKFLNYGITGVALNLIKCYLAYSLHFSVGNSQVPRLNKVWYT